MNFKKHEKIFSSISITKEHSPSCLSLSLGVFQYIFIRHIFHLTFHTFHGNPRVTYENLFFKKLKQQINNKNVNLKKFKFLKSTVTTVYSLHYKHTENIKYKRDHETLAVFETTAHNVSQFSQNQTEQT